MKDVVAFAKIMEARGIDYISCTGADIINQKATVPTMYMPRGYNIANAEIVKKAVKVPVMVASGINVEIGEQVLREGKADMVGMSRGLVADPELINKLMEGRIEDIRPCIRGGIGCASHARFNKTLACEVNPSIGKESDGNPGQHSGHTSQKSGGNRRRARRHGSCQISRSPRS